MPAIAAIIGAAASGNPLASVGASREIKMLISYELPFILAIVSVIIKSDSIRLSQIIAHQAQAGSFIFSWSGISAFLVAIFCMQAKLGFVPFDAAEAEQEIMGGTLIEYSGFPLALFRLTKAMLLYTLPLFLISLFWGCTLGWAIIAKYIILLVGIILIKNTNPRLRIDQAMRWFWGPMTILAVLSVVLAVGGL
jgi:NADH-quinone oxidoreductase subunit H